MGGLLQLQFHVFLKQCSSNGGTHQNPYIPASPHPGECREEPSRAAVTCKVWLRVLPRNPSQHGLATSPQGPPCL